MAFDKKTMIIPDNTLFEEKTIITKGDIVLSDRIRLDYGIITSKRVFVGTRAKISGNLFADGDIRVDMWSNIEGDLTSKNSVYLGDRVKLSGKLSVSDDLDIGEDVEIKDGFQANGWINIRNPIPMVVYLFIYLFEMMRMGREHEVDKILEEMSKDDDVPLILDDNFMFVPRDTVIGVHQTIIPGKCKIGSNSRVLGNYKATGTIRIGKNTRVFGAVKSEHNIHTGENCEIHGDIDAIGVVHLKEGCHVFGDINGQLIELGQNVIVDGMLNAKDGIQFVSATPQDAERKSDRVDKDARYDVLDLLN